MNQSAYRWEMVEPDAPLVKKDFEAAPVAPNDVTVEIEGCGVCHTDLGFYYDGVRPRHDLPLALGHEISGRVVDAGDEAHSLIGKAVVICSVIPCGECDLCRAGLGRICGNQKMPGNDIQGGFATHITVPATGACVVDEHKLEKSGLSLSDLSVIADAVTTPYQAAVNAGLKEGDLAVVVGVGGVGGYAVQIANAFGATVVAIDIDDTKLEKIADFGAAKTYNATAFDERALKKEISNFAREAGLPAVGRTIFECSGTAAGQKTAFSLLTFGATLCVVGFTLDKIEVRLSNLMAFDARAIGNWGCLAELYPDAIELVLDGKVELAPFIEPFPLDDINEIFHRVHEGELDRRAILVPNGKEQSS